MYIKEYFKKENQLLNPHPVILILCVLMQAYMFIEFYKVTISKFQLQQMFSIFQSPQLLGEGNGTPLQYSCLENPMDGGAW